MRVGDQCGGRPERAVGVPRDHLQLVRPDPLRVPGDPGQTGRAGQVGVARAGAGGDRVERRTGGGEQLHRRRPQTERPELPQVGHLERLDEHGRVGPVQPVPAQHVDQPGLERQPGGLEVGRVLGLRVDPELAPELAGEPAAQLEQLDQGGHLEPAVEQGVVLPHLGKPLDRAQGLDLGQGEVLGEPAGDRDAVQQPGGPAGGELRTGGDVGGAADLRLVPADQHAVLGRHQVRLHEVGAHPGGQIVGGEGVFRPVAGGAAVPDHERATASRVYPGRPGDVGAEPGAGERDGEGGCGKPGERGASGGHENLQGLVSGRRHQPTGTAWPGRSRREYVR